MEKDCTSIVIHTVTRQKSGHTTKQAKKKSSTREIWRASGESCFCCHRDKNSRDRLPCYMHQLVLVTLCQGGDAGWRMERWPGGTSQHPVQKVTSHWSTHLVQKKNKGDFAHAPSPQLTRAVALVYTRWTGINLTFLIHTDKHLSDNSLRFGCGNTILRACGDVQWDCFKWIRKARQHTQKKSFCWWFK